MPNKEPWPGNKKKQRNLRAVPWTEPRGTGHGMGSPGDHGGQLKMKRRKMGWGREAQTPHPQHRMFSRPRKIENKSDNQKMN